MPIYGLNYGYLNHRVPDGLNQPRVLDTGLRTDVRRALPADDLSKVFKLRKEGVPSHDGLVGGYAVLINEVHGEQVAGVDEGGCGRKIELIPDAGDALDGGGLDVGEHPVDEVDAVRADVVEGSASGVVSGARASGAGVLEVVENPAVVGADAEELADAAALEELDGAPDLREEAVHQAFKQDELVLGGKRVEGLCVGVGEDEGGGLV